MEGASGEELVDLLRRDGSMIRIEGISCLQELTGRCTSIKVLIFEHVEEHARGKGV
jgi:hypothetical protein